jgi:hypothetical protein
MTVTMKGFSKVLGTIKKKPTFGKARFLNP